MVDFPSFRNSGKTGRGAGGANPIAALGGGGSFRLRALERQKILWHENTVFSMKIFRERARESSEEGGGGR